MRKRLLTAVVATLASPFIAGTAYAAPDFNTFNANDTVWGCAGDAGIMLPPQHCINLKSQGDTGLILVFPTDARWPQESISTNPKSDTRPCPHDDAATDGTWWTPPGTQGVWVCHHRKP